MKHSVGWSGRFRGQKMGVGRWMAEVAAVVVVFFFTVAASRRFCPIRNNNETNEWTSFDGAINVTQPALNSHLNWSGRRWLGVRRRWNFVSRFVLLERSSFSPPLFSSILENEKFSSRWRLLKFFFFFFFFFENNNNDTVEIIFIHLERNYWD